MDKIAKLSLLSPIIAHNQGSCRAKILPYRWQNLCFWILFSARPSPKTTSGTAPLPRKNGDKRKKSVFLMQSNRFFPLFFQRKSTVLRQDAASILPFPIALFNPFCLSAGCAVRKNTPQGMLWRRWKFAKVHNRNTPVFLSRTYPQKSNRWKSIPWKSTS